MGNTLFILTCGSVLLITAGCGYISKQFAPPGAFPSQVGPYKLEAYEKEPDNPNYDAPRLYHGRYRSTGGETIQVDVTVYPSAKDAERNFRLDRSDAKSTDEELVSLVGDKVQRVSMRPGESVTSYTWVRGTWYCHVIGDNGKAVEQFTEDLRYK